jgi:IS1 family transposase
MISYGRERLRRRRRKIKRMSKSIIMAWLSLLEILNLICRFKLLQS